MKLKDVLKVTDLPKEPRPSRTGLYDIAEFGFLKAKGSESYKPVLSIGLQNRGNHNYFMFSEQAEIISNDDSGAFNIQCVDLNDVVNYLPARRLILSS